MISPPNLFVIGAPKSGTTAFVSALQQHSDIYVPEEKEPRFFDSHTFYDFEDDYPYKCIQEYLSIYSSSKAQKKKYRVDGSVFNMYDKKSIASILNISKAAKFILIVRDPLDATKSMFSQRMKYIIPELREIYDSFDDCWELIENKDRSNGKGFPKKCRNTFLFRYDLLYSYEKYIPFLKSMIKADYLLIVSYSEFRNTPEHFYKKVFDFLEIENTVNIKNNIKNKSFHVKQNLITKILGIISFKTFKLREKLGLTGGHLGTLRQLLISAFMVSPRVSNKSDEKVKEYFKATYKYLDSLGIDLTLDKKIQ